MNNNVIFKVDNVLIPYRIKNKCGFCNPDKTIAIPKRVKETIDKMKISEQQSKYLHVRGDNDLFHCDFIQIGQIIVSNWKVFKNFFSNENEHWVNKYINYKNKMFSAHNSFVYQNERNALKVYYNI